MIRLLLLSLASSSFAQTTINGDAWILGALVVKGKTETKFNGGATILYSEDAIAQYITRNGSYATLSWREINP